MFFTRIGLEQATDEWVARYKASRFAAQRAGASSPPVVADLCCGIGGDLHGARRKSAQPSASTATQSPPTSPPSTPAHAVHTIDVTDFDLDGIAAWHIDPDRRPAGHRTTSLEWCEPNLATIERLLSASAATPP